MRKLNFLMVPLINITITALMIYAAFISRS